MSLIREFQKVIKIKLYYLVDYNGIQQNVLLYFKQWCLIIEIKWHLIGINKGEVKPKKIYLYFYNKYN